MPDNKKKKKLDSKRIALSQKYEREYLKKTAEKLIQDFLNEKKWSAKSIILSTKLGTAKNVGIDRIVKCLKALVLLLEKYGKK